MGGETQFFGRKVNSGKEDDGWFCAGNVWTEEHCHPRADYLAPGFAQKRKKKLVGAFYFGPARTKKLPSQAAFRLRLVKGRGLCFTHEAPAGGTPWMVRCAWSKELCSDWGLFVLSAFKKRVVILFSTTEEPIPPENTHPDHIIPIRDSANASYVLADSQAAHKGVEPRPKSTLLLIGGVLVAKGGLFVTGQGPQGVIREEGAASVIVCYERTGRSSALWDNVF